MPNDGMHAIGHHDERVKGNLILMLRQVLPRVLDHQPTLVKVHLSCWIRRIRYIDGTQAVCSVGDERIVIG